jgi:hypothetical protein
MAELKDCPFCGGAPETDSMRAHRSLVTGDLGYHAAVYCTGSCSAEMTLCRGDVPHLTDEERLAVLVENWNRRAQPQSGDGNAPHG